MDPSRLTLPKPLPGFGGSSSQPPINLPPQSSQPANIAAVAQASYDPGFQMAAASQTVQQSSEEKDMDVTPGYSTQTSTESSDSDMETLHLIRKRGNDGQYKVNAEANDAIREIAKTANKDPDFSLDKVDFSAFGQKVIDIDFDARSILFDSQKELQSLITLTSDDSTGYGTASSSQSEYSFGSAGIPTAKSETYMKLKRKLDIIKTTRNYRDMLRLKDEVEVEMVKLQEEEQEKSNIYAGLHLDGSASETQLDRLKTRWHGKQLKSLFNFFVSYFKENRSSSDFFSPR